MKTNSTYFDYPYGMVMPGRHGQAADDYRYGFNGMEADDEIKNGDKNSYDFGARMYDPRVGRWLSVDPMAAKYTSQTPYSFSLNSPLLFKDPDGKDAIVTISTDPEGNKIITFSTTLYLSGKGYSKEDVARIKEVIELNFSKQIIFEGVDSKGQKAYLNFDINIVDASPETTNEAGSLPAGIAAYAKRASSEDFNNVRIDSKNIDKDNNGNPKGMEKGSNMMLLGFKGTSQASGYRSFAYINQFTKDDIALTVTHELFHLLGLSDRYDSNAKTNYERVPHEGFEKCIMGGNWFDEKSLKLVLNQANINSMIQSGLEISMDPKNTNEVNGTNVQTIFSDISSKSQKLDNKDPNKQEAVIETP